MKKYLLSAFVVFAFIAYSIHLRTEDGEASKVVIPKSLTNTTSNPASSDDDSVKPVTTPTNSVGSSSVGQSPVISSPKGKYKDGQYTGVVTDAFYGNIQVRATVSGGKLTDVQFLQYPNDRQTSIEINTQAMPYLRFEALQAQSARVDIVSGATDSSRAFRTSLESALAQAR